MRTEAPLFPELVTTYPERLAINRTNPYVKPKGYLNLADGLKSFETAQCTGGAVATFPPKAATIADPNFNVRTGGDVALAEAFYDRLKEFSFNNQDSTASIATAPCVEQSPFESIGSPAETSDYLHVYPYP